METPMTDATHSLDLVKAQAENLAHIRRMQEETRKFVAEQQRLFAEEVERSRGRDLPPWLFAFGGMVVGAAIVCTTAAIIKIFG